MLIIEDTDYSQGQMIFKVLPSLGLGQSMSSTLCVSVP